MVTLQISVSYVRPTPMARVIARGEVLRFGTSGVAMQGTLRDADGQVLAVATATAVPRPLVM
jgi:acyl-coenzyme A thioesterase PaaI-like protein